ncbi:hypothetical protein [Mammaliicoccus sciuri]
MSQTIQATINIPPDYVLIKKVEHEQLVEKTSHSNDYEGSM